MKNNKQELIKHRAQAIAHYIIYNKSTMKSAASVFAVSRDTVSDDINKRLESIDSDLYIKVKKVIKENKTKSLSKNNKIRKVAK